ncbi:UNVERIFIED_CONTAM: hypothetical protein Slati_3765900 [Sesamum latifolium]|uniref:Reverse transcriptase domain-containing protein n=1 Tax=Sesamum latifolium TaxID=2727402 RepID=A0AAW2U4D3_9LAMI
MNELTADLSRPDLARVGVELDLTAPKVQAVYLQIEGKTYRQQVIYENCPPYCSSCNHLGHDISSCIAKHNNEKSQIEMEPRPIGNTPNQTKDPMDLSDIINNKRKGKNVVIAIINVENNTDNGVSSDLPSEPPVNPTSSRPSQVEVALPDDFNYEDPLIAELLDKDWDVKKTSRNESHYINIEPEDSMNNRSEQDAYISVVPNSLSEETSPQVTEVHTASHASEGGEEHIPISNCFQSLEDMETEDILQHVENLQNSTTFTEGTVAVRGDEDGHTPHTVENTLDTVTPTQEGGTTQQEIIFTDSTVPNKHKRNKSFKGTTEKSSKIGGKGRKGKGGDCNAILHPYENQGGNMRRMGSMDDFNDMIIDTGLIDTGFEGEPFIWTNKRIWKRLDKVLYSKEWVEIFNATRVLHLPRILSDHHPFLIDVAKNENKRTKELLKQWNKDTFGHIFTAIERAKQDATEAEKKFNRDRSEANLIALNKSNADFIAKDIQEAARDFFCGTPMPRSFKAATIVLIPKVESPQTRNDFRSISLCNVTNKIMSKLLYKKLAQALSDLISPSQSGFVPDRLISDNNLMAQEMIYHLDLRYKNSNLVIKLDMSKAYDRVNWNFLITVMQKMGFPPRFLTLIKHAVQNYWFTILVNREATGFFKSNQGLRQGDPISPTLFILAAKAFSKGLDLLFNDNPDMYYQTKCEVKISHLSYADDVILFTNCNEAGLIKLMHFLRNYEELSGQKINHTKSAFIPGKKANLIAQRIKNITGFSMKALPITYLGAPLYKGNRRKILNENLIDKVRARISGWEHCHLSYGGVYS